MVLFFGESFRVFEATEEIDDFRDLTDSVFDSLEDSPPFVLIRLLPREDDRDSSFTELKTNLSYQ